MGSTRKAPLATLFRGRYARWICGINVCPVGPQLGPVLPMLARELTDRSLLHLLLTRELQFPYHVTSSSRLRLPARAKPWPADKLT
jgi:hypothetical protein